MEALKFSTVFGLCLCAVLTAACFVFTPQIVKMFLSDQSALEYGVLFSRIMLSTAWLFGVYYVLVNAMQALGAAMPSLIVSVCRQGIVYIPLVFIMGALLGMNGLVWAQPAADLISLAMTVFLFLGAMKTAKWEKTETEK